MGTPFSAINCCKRKLRLAIVRFLRPLSEKPSLTRCYGSGLVDNVPGFASISDNSSVDSLFFSCASESEGGIWGNNNYDDDASMLMREQTLSHPISMEMRKLSLLPTSSQLLRALLVELVGKQM